VPELEAFLESSTGVDPREGLFEVPFVAPDLPPHQGEPMAGSRIQLVNGRLLAVRPWGEDDEGVGVGVGKGKGGEYEVEGDIDTLWDEIGLGLEDVQKIVRKVLGDDAKVVEQTSEWKVAAQERGAILASVKEARRLEEEVRRCAIVSLL